MSSSSHLSDHRSIMRQWSLQAGEIFGEDKEAATAFQRTMDAALSALETLDSEQRQAVEKIIYKYNELSKREKDDHFTKFFETLSNVNIKDTSRTIFQEMALHMSDYGLITVRQSRFSESLGMSRSSLARGLKELEDADLIRQYPTDKLKLPSGWSRNNGTIYMINPSAATKRTDRSTVSSIWYRIGGSRLSMDNAADWTSMSVPSDHGTGYARIATQPERNKKANSTVPTAESASQKDNESNLICTYSIPRKADPTQALAPDFIPDLNKNPFSFTGEV